MESQHLLPLKWETASPLHKKKKNHIQLQKRCENLSMTSKMFSTHCGHHIISSHFEWKMAVSAII